MFSRTSVNKAFEPLNLAKDDLLKKPDLSKARMMIPERCLDLSRCLKIKEAMGRLDYCLDKNASVSDINKMKPNPFNLLIENILTAKKIKKQLHIQ